MEVNKMNELKQCPFCGGAAEVYEYDNGHKGNGIYTATYRIGCPKCKVYFTHNVEFKLEKGQPVFIQNGYEKCANAWNRRIGNE
ncbi:Lar-like restriction alleviation protein [Clostridium phage Amboise]|jgi:hypothetical protein|nr:Lar-like restriction alleviation protein [Clostridium phage Amboise]